MCSRRYFYLFFMLLFVVGLYGCGGSGGSTSTISGVVADGYVKNAKVYVYSDMAMTKQIGSGVTDSNGKFSIALTTAIPNVVYLKSVGGVITDTGMAAPTMSSVIPASSVSVGESSNITPITNYLYKETVSMDGNLTGAINKLKDTLGITSDNMMWQDPVSDTSLAGPLNQVLASGSMASTLSDGTYKVTLFWFDNNDIGNTAITFSTIDDIITNRKCQFSVSISNGDISGYDDSGDSIVGKVEGSGLLMNIVSTSGVTRVCGNIGMLGSVTGTYTDYDSSSSTLARGLFVASFIPASGVNKDALVNVINNIYSGEKHSIFRDVFGTDHDVAWANMSISIDNSTLAVTANDFSVYCVGDNTTNAPILSTTETFNSGELVTDSDGSLDNIIILRFVEADGITNDFFIQAIGSRQGVYLSTNATAGYTVSSVGESYMSSANDISKCIDNSTTYNINTATLGIYDLGLARQTVLPTVLNSYSLTSPSDISSSPYLVDNVTDTLYVFNGSVLTMAHNPSGDFDTNSSDFIASAITYGSGAIEGQIMQGGTGTVLGTAVSLYLYPSPFVGMILPQGASAPSFVGIKHILVRVIYTNDYSEYQNAYYYGTVTVTGEGQGTVKLDVKNAQGDECVSTLNCENVNGILHIYGADDPNDSLSYMDIYWPIGGYKAIYFHSDANDGNGNIDEIGSAYLTD